MNNRLEELDVLISGITGFTFEELCAEAIVNTDKDDLDLLKEYISEYLEIQGS